MTSVRAAFVVVMLGMLLWSTAAFAKTLAYRPLTAEESAPNSSTKLDAWARVSPETTVVGWFTFDNGNQPDTQGWTSVDLTEAEALYFHVDDFAGLNGPILTAPGGNKAMWCGARPASTNPLCSYASLPGYGNNWDQMLCLSDSISGPDIELSFSIHYDTEPGYDEWSVEFWGYDDWFDRDEWMPIVGLSEISGTGLDTLTAHVPDSLLAGATLLRFRFKSDDYWSDEDGLWDTDGAVVLDDINLRVDGINIHATDFEGDLVNATQTAHWNACAQIPLGDFAGLYPAVALAQEDPCRSEVSNAWVFFIGSAYTGSGGVYADLPIVPYGSSATSFLSNAIVSPALPLVAAGGNWYLEFDVYRDLPLEAHVFYRWDVRFLVDDCWSRWEGASRIYFGSQKDWFRQQADFSELLVPGASELQVRFQVFDLCESLCSVFGGTPHTQSPVFDNVAIYNVDLNGPEWISSDVEQFNDNFSSDGTITGTARADGADDLVPAANPNIQFADSALILVRDRGHGLMVDSYSGTGAAVYLLASVSPQGQPTKVGHALTQDSFRFPVVHSSVAGGKEWTWLRCDTSFTGPGRSSPETDRFCIDLNDNLFTPGDTVSFFYASVNAIGEWSYHSVTGGTVDNIADAAIGADEFTVLPTLTGAGNGNVLFVNQSSDLNSTPQYESMFDALGVNVDTYRARGRRVPGIESKIENVTVQLLANYDVVVFECGDDLLIGDGTGLAHKSDDALLFKLFLDGLDRVGGVVLAGPDLPDAMKWLTGPGLAALRSTYVNYDLLNPNHYWAGLLRSPSVEGTQPGPFAGETFVAFGDCPDVTDFDVIAASGNGELLASYDGSPITGATIGQKTLNPDSVEVGVVLSGFGLRDLRDDDTDGISDRVTYLAQVLAWLGQSVGAPTTTTSPRSTRLAQNYPNPFNPTTTIEYSLARTSHVELAIFDVTGRRIRTLVNGVQRPGEVAPQVWDGTNDGGVAVASGVYFYRLSTPEFTRTRKMVLLK